MEGPITHKSATPIERVRVLATRLAGEGDEIERQRKVPDGLQAALQEAGLFRLLLPRQFGGEEVDPVTFITTVEEVAKHDASTAWCVGQNGVTAMAAAFLDPKVAREIWRPSNAILAWGPGPGAKAVVVDGGYRLTGKWSFASGGRHATWFGAYCMLMQPDGKPVLDDKGAPLGRTLLFPASSAQMIDIWDVVGLNGTGSDGYTVTDLFVPAACSFQRDDMSERRYDAPLYHFPTNAIFAGTFSCVALGIARSMLDAFLALAREKTPRGFKRPLAENGVVQSRVAQSEARLRAARRLIVGSYEEIWARVQATQLLDIDDRITIRLAATHAIQEAKAVADTAWDLAGATAVFASSPFERRFRDIHTVAQQLQGRFSHYETVGQHMLGLDTDLGWV
jgi:alkylation response protein AidB-like acyl-CoA dehydrogenase